MIKIKFDDDVVMSQRVSLFMRGSIDEQEIEPQMRNCAESCDELCYQAQFPLNMLVRSSLYN